MSGWQTGRAHIEQLIDRRWIESVRASGDLANRLLHESSAHLQTAHNALDDDPTGALQLAYDAARKAAIALLTAQGLRATTDGGHKAAAEAAGAQFNGTFDRLGRMRRRRNDAEYPDIDTPDMTEDDANDAIESAQKMHDAAVALLASGKLGVFAE